LGPSPYPVNHPKNPQIFGDPEKVGKCLLHTDGTSPESNAETAYRLTPMMVRKVIIKIRKEKLPEPSVVGSAGSFFKNPVISREHFECIEAAAKAEFGPDYKVPHYIIETEPSPCHPEPSSCHHERSEGSSPEQIIKVPAAWMIEQCGWKGRRSGGAAVWEKQPLVIVNYTGEAYPEEIVGLEKRIIASVKAKFGVELHPEVEHI
jgi:UDP-N-acetylmuramate dehydrogenase